MLDDFEFRSCQSAFQLYEGVSKAMGVQDQASSAYYDRKSQLTPEEYATALSESTTLYVGGVSLFAQEWAIINYFAMACPSQTLKRVVMGINRKTQKPCGFCFLEFATRTAA